MRGLLPTLLLLAASCAAPQKPVVAAHAPVTAQTGVRVEVVGFGLSAEFPKPPTTATTATDKARTVFVSQRGPQSYQLTAVSTHRRDRAKDDEWYEGLRAKLKLEKHGDVQLAGFRGVELRGKNDNHPLITRLFAVGDTLFLAEVVGSEGPLDEPAALRFLDSLQLELPWRVYASPTTKFSVMIPTHAIEIDKTQVHEVRRSSSKAFFLGGPNQLIYWATGDELIDRNPEISDDQILDAAIDGIQSNGVRVTWQGPLAAAGLRGREFLASSSGESMMGRVWLGERFVYVLLVSANSRAALQAADTSKFYGSFVAY
jgi:hypothetical protein